MTLREMLEAIMKELGIGEDAEETDSEEDDSETESED